MESTVFSQESTAIAGKQSEKVVGVRSKNPAMGEQPKSQILSFCSSRPWWMDNLYYQSFSTNIWQKSHEQMIIRTASKLNLKEGQQGGIREKNRNFILEPHVR